MEGLAVVVRVNCWVKLAVTLLLVSKVTTQEPVPEQPAPLHPLNTELAPGVAVSVTTVFLSNCALQEAPQLIPEGVLVTVPEPLLVTVRVSCPVKVAVTLLLALMVTKHDPVPEQAPDQPVKDQPELGEAVTVTWEPEG